MKPDESVIEDGCSNSEKKTMIEFQFVFKPFSDLVKSQKIRVTTY